MAATTIHRDAKIAREILKQCYAVFEKHPAQWLDGRDLPNTVGFDEKEIVYVISRMEDREVLTQYHAGTRLPHLRITAAGVDRLSDEGGQTILADDIRFRILGTLYLAKRNGPRWGHVARSEIAKGFGVEEQLIMKNAAYLEMKGLVKSGGGLGNYLGDFVITDSGIRLHERYETSKEHESKSSRVGDVRQILLGPGEQSKAETLFREIVELASREVIVVDAYVREPFYPMLVHIPSRVEVKILTSEKAKGPTYASVVQRWSIGRKLDVRAMPWSEWRVHSRFLIVDREEGWNWDNSFHDAGEKQQTITEIKPINLRTTLADFEAAWVKAERV